MKSTSNKTRKSLFILTLTLLLSPLTYLVPAAEAANEPTEIVDTPYIVTDTLYPLDALHAPTMEIDRQNDGQTVVVEDMESLIRRVAAEHNFKWPDYLVKLAKCESSLNPKATNNRGNYPSTSTDKGIFQINDYWHPEVTDEVVFDPTLATEWTMWRIENGYQHEWACDKLIK